jgi:type II secretory pathway pseudopilin PulG
MNTRIRILRDRSGRAGFTLIEMLVAVGAVALVGVAIAAVFDAVGKTVTTGKRVAALNTYANLIKQQMERDFASMTRQGFLVIRNEMAGDFDPYAGDAPPPIPLYADQPADDPTIRPRRTDEIMFFSEADFTTAREVLDPRFIARSDAARIYYGHGKRRRSNSSPTAPYLAPTLFDLNEEPNSWLGQQVAGNPNRYASDWMLLRHVTLLCPLQSTNRPAPNIAALGIPGTNTYDTDTQIALQPAASNLFRGLAVLFPVANPSGGRPQVPIRPGRPLFTPGLIDIATTSLSEVRGIVTTADTWPGGPPTGYSGNAADADFFDPTQNAGADGSNEGLDGMYRRINLLDLSEPGTDGEVLARMQTWMIDALPGWSTAPDIDDRSRIRYEPEAPNYLGVTGDPMLTPLQGAAFRADQLMLSSSNFLPRCTEFIVEWSFGRAYPSTTGANYWATHEGELIWHGMQRLADGEPIGYNDPDVELAVARPYTGDGVGVAAGAL